MSIFSSFMRCLRNEGSVLRDARNTGDEKLRCSQQHVVSLLALAAADELAQARHQQVHAGHLLNTG